MKVYELLALNRELIERMCAAGVRLDDVRYVGLYRDYLRMRRAARCRISLRCLRSVTV